MKKYLKIWSLLLSVGIAAACGKGKNDHRDGVEVDLEEAILKAEGRRAANPDAKGGNTCLLNYNLNYDHLLTEEIVIDATGFSKEVLDVKYSKAMKNPEYHSVSYRFANKRKARVKELDIETEVRDAVTLKSVKAMSMNSFKSLYRAVTDEEIEVGNQTIDDVVEGKIEDKKVSAKLEEMESRGINKKTTTGAIGTMKGAFEKVGKSYTNVEGLGDAATWNTHTNDLNVLQNGVQFELNVNISNDNEKNKGIAISIAKVLLSKCS